MHLISKKEIFWFLLCINEGIKMDANKAKAIMKAKPLSNRKEL